VEVERVTFDIWVAEGEERSTVMLNGELEDEATRVVVVEVSEVGDEASDDGEINSGEDEASMDEVDVDMRKKLVQGVGHEDENNGSRRKQTPKEGNKALTSTKSSTLANVITEIPYVPWLRLITWNRRSDLKEKVWFWLLLQRW
jgi:NADPH-dependent glutamate synthase beta subunit-like oxidoreductase